MVEIYKVIAYIPLSIKYSTIKQKWQRKLNNKSDVGVINVIPTLRSYGGAIKNDLTYYYIIYIVILKHVYFLLLMEFNNNIGTMPQRSNQRNVFCIS